MTLLIRADDREGVLRSVGDPPNGILCMGTPGQTVSWLIDGQYLPRGPRSTQPVAIDHRPNDEGVGPDSTVIEPLELVAACASKKEAGALLLMISAALGFACQLATETLNYEFVGSHLDLAIATRQALVDHGYLRAPGEAAR